MNLSEGALKLLQYGLSSVQPTNALTTLAPLPLVLMDRMRAGMGLPDPNRGTRRFVPAPMPAVIAQRMAESAQGYAPQAQVAQAAPEPAAEPAGYTVQKGDNLWKIAQRTLGDGRRWTEIAAANNLENPDLIRPGQQLALPAAEPDQPVNALVPRQPREVRPASPLSSLSEEQLQAAGLIVKNEGKPFLKAGKDVASKDPLIGWGFNLSRPDAAEAMRYIGADLEAVRSGEPITQEQAVKLLDYTLKADEQELVKLVPRFESLPAPAKAALRDLVYQVGAKSLSGFKSMLAHLNAGNFASAAEALLGSKLAQQTPGRARANAQLIGGVR